MCSDEEVETIRAVKSHLDRWFVILGCSGSLTRVSLLRVQKLPCESGISVPSASRRHSYKSFSAAITLQG